MSTYKEISLFIINTCNLIIRDTFKRHEHGDLILPFIVLRRMDLVIEQRKDEIVKIHDQYKTKFDDTSKIIHSKLKIKFSNYSKFDLYKLTQDPNNIFENINDYLDSFSPNVLEIIKNFSLHDKIEKLLKNDLLYIFIEKLSQIDIHPSNIDNHTMGNIYEELLRRFSEMSNETSGEHYTPRDVVKLLVSLVFSSDITKLSDPSKIISVYDPCCGTGGMLTIGKEWLLEHSKLKKENINLFGQEKNDITYSVCKSDFLITDEEPENIKYGSSLTNDQHVENNRKFDYLITNPPYGETWEKERSKILKESKEYGGRFSVGIPRVSDGSLLFLQHMISKMEIKGSRIGVVFNGSPLFTGDSGSGESEIRKWIIENDWLECIVSLPDSLFFNTGISTYIWIVTNKKNSQRKGKVQLIDGSSFYKSMKKSLGKKRKDIEDSKREELLQTYQKFEENEHSKIFDNEFFGYTKVTIEQPKVENGQVVRDKKGNPKPDSKLRDYERVPLSEDIEQYFSREVEPHLPNSWIDFNKSKVGYEINFTKYFYEYKPLRSSEDITRDLLELDKESENLLNQIMD